MFSVDAISSLAHGSIRSIYPFSMYDLQQDDIMVAKRLEFRAVGATILLALFDSVKLVASSSWKPLSIAVPSSWPAHCPLNYLGTEQVA